MLKRNMDQPDRLEALHRMMSASKAASASRLTQLTIPSLVIMGSKDPDFKDPSTEAESIAGQIKGKAQMVSGAGHYPQAESPEITGPIILDFLKTLQLEANHAAI
jgi:pimeloyl-ACP methyl ester carboxylesterase